MFSSQPIYVLGPLQIVGVSDTVDHLVRDHASIVRSVVHIQLPRMNERELKEILEKGEEGLRYSHAHILSAPEEDYRKEEDIAELQFDDATGVPCLSLGSSGDAVEGEAVLVIGNPDRLTR